MVCVVVALAAVAGPIEFLVEPQGTESLRAQLPAVQLHEGSISSGRRWSSG